MKFILIILLLITFTNCSVEFTSTIDYKGYGRVEEEISSNVEFFARTEQALECLSGICLKVESDETHYYFSAKFETVPFQFNVATVIVKMQGSCMTIASEIINQDKITFNSMMDGNNTNICIFTALIWGDEIFNTYHDLWRGTQVPAFSWGWREGSLITTDNNKGDNYLYKFPLNVWNEGILISQSYDGKFSHSGVRRYAIDYIVHEGTEVYSMRDGIVIKIKEDSNSSCGTVDCANQANKVYIYHNDGTTGRYLHLKINGSLVNEGDTIKAGDLIGLSGNTGWSTGPHLHTDVHALYWNQSINHWNEDLFTVRVQLANGYDGIGFIPTHDSWYKEFRLNGTNKGYICNTTEVSNVCVPVDGGSYKCFGGDADDEQVCGLGTCSFYDYCDCTAAIDVEENLCGDLEIGNQCTYCDANIEGSSGETTSQASTNSILIAIICIVYKMF